MRPSLVVLLPLLLACGDRAVGDGNDGGSSSSSGSSGPGGSSSDEGVLDAYYADVEAMGGARWDTSSLIARLERARSARGENG